MGMLVKYLTIYLMNCILWGTRNIRRTFNFLGEPDAQCTAATLTKTVPTIRYSCLNCSFNTVYVFIL